MANAGALGLAFASMPESGILEGRLRTPGFAGPQEGFAVPLYDHFHAPLRERRPWESFHAAWATCLAKALNHGVLPRGFIAHEQVHAGPAVEIDVAAYDEQGKTNGAGGGTATLPRTVWTPAAAPLVMPSLYPPRYTVEIHQEGG